MIIEVIGMGCPSCKATLELVEKVVQEEGIKAEVKEIKDINVIAERGIMMMPAVVINGEVKISGRVPTPNELKELLK